MVQLGGALPSTTMSTVPRWPSVMIPIKRPWKLTAGYPKWLALEKVKFPLNMVIVCIYVRFLRCKHRPFLLAPQRKNLRVLAFDHLFGVRKGMVFLNTHRSHSYLKVRNMVILGCWSFRKKYAVEEIGLCGYAFATSFDRCVIASTQVVCIWSKLVTLARTQWTLWLF